MAKWILGGTMITESELRYIIERVCLELKYHDDPDSRPFYDLHSIMDSVERMYGAQLGWTKTYDNIHQIRLEAKILPQRMVKLNKIHRSRSDD